MPGKAFIVDGNSFCYRAFYAIRELATSRGEPTNAIYGVIIMLRKILKEEQPDYFAVSFDLPKPTFRHERYADYKIHRAPMPDALIEQIPHIKELIRAYRIPIFEKEGYEADDILGTLARRLEEEGLEVFIVTGDKDAFQLLSDRIKIYNPHKEGEVSDVKGVRERFGGLGPESVVDVMALAGDASDNIPGVPGIGAKTAVSLIKQFGTLDRLYERLGDVKSAKMKQSLKDNEKLARLSQELARIDREVPIPFSLPDLVVKEPDREALAGLFKRFEFRGLLKEVVPQGEADQAARSYHTVRTERELRKLAASLEQCGAFAVDTETTSANPHLAHLVGMSFSWQEKEAFYVPLKSPHHQGEGIALEEALQVLRPILEDRRLKKLGQNIKYDCMVFRNHGVRLAGIHFDTMVASYLLQPHKRNHNLDDLALECLGVKKIATAELIGRGKNEVTMDQVPLEKVAEYACEDADCVFRLKQHLAPRLADEGLEKLFYDLEMPLIEVLAEIEMNGVKIDAALLKDFGSEAERELEKLTREIYEEAGEDFNINSPKQLADILFQKLKLPALRKTKTGYSTDVEVLEKLAVEHRLPRLLLDYRERAKLKSTYFDALPELVNPRTELIHTSFNQTTTTTGRLSSSEPNLQNIPIRTEMGRKIRRAFVPRAGGRKIVSADYSQIELRLLAHFSDDPSLAEAFRKDADVHQFTASLLYGVNPEEVTREMRSAAKTINFSIIYGKTPYGLSRDLEIPIGEAELFIQSYFARYPKVKEYLDAQREKARKEGFLRTILGRKAYFPDITSANPTLRQFAERAAVNAPLQGSAADLVKLAMLALDRALEEKGLDALMILQVHDELVFDVRAEAVDDLVMLAREKMEGALELRVPLRVNFSVGDSWYVSD
jgi:DNA polymerase-1